MEKNFEKTINGFLESNAVISQYITKTLPKVLDSLQKTKFKYTSKALLSFIPRSGYINSAILNASGTKNIYASAILFRPMIEHNFRHLYIFIKALNDNNDSIGSTYYKSLKGNEDLESVQKIINYNKIVYPEDTKWNTKGEHNKTIREDAKSFRIEKIFHYLINNNNEKDEVLKKYKKEYLLERLIQYTNLSSSVHGGPFGEETLMIAQKGNPKVALLKFATESFELHKNLVETTYLFAYIMNDGNKDLYENIKNIK